MAKRSGQCTLVLDARDFYRRRTVGLYHVNWADKRAEFGRLLVGKSDSRRSGLGREASRLVLSLARQAGLEETYLDVKSDNIAAITIYRDLNFHVVNEANGIAQMRLFLLDDQSLPIGRC
jgi:RimJ/RimL family protein N-acetyltransferase